MSGLNKNPSQAPQIKHKSSEISSTESEICLMLTDFVKTVDLSDIRTQISEENSFVKRIEVLKGQSLLCYFDDICDMIELNQGKQYGAGKAVLLNNGSSRQLNSIRQDQIQLGLFKAFETEPIGFKVGSLRNIPLKEEEFLSEVEEIDQQQNCLRPIQRCTSLEDEVKQLEKLRQSLQLMPQSQFSRAVIFDKNLSADTHHCMSCQQKQLWEVGSTLNNSLEDGQSETGNEAPKKMNKKVTSETLQILVQSTAFTIGIYGIYKIVKSCL